MSIFLIQVFQQFLNFLTLSNLVKDIEGQLGSIINACATFPSRVLWTDASSKKIILLVNFSLRHLKRLVADMSLSWVTGRISSDEIEDIIMVESEVCCTFFI